MFYDVNGGTIHVGDVMRSRVSGKVYSVVAIATNDNIGPVILITRVTGTGFVRALSVKAFVEQQFEDLDWVTIEDAIGRYLK